MRIVRRPLQQRASARLGWLYLVILVSGEQACLLEERSVVPVHTGRISREVQVSIVVTEKQACIFAV